MDIVHRIWSREPASADTGLSLAERLKQLTEEKPSDESEKPGKTGKQAQSAASSASAPDSPVTVATDVDPPAEGESSAETEALDSEDGRTGKPAANAQPDSFATAAEMKAHSPADKLASAFAHGPQSGANSPSGPGRKVFRAPRWGSKPENLESADRDESSQEVTGLSAQVRHEDPSLSPASAELDPQLLEQIKEAVDRAEKNGETALSSVHEFLAEWQSAQQKFEAGIQERLDGALAQVERRLSSPVLPENFAEQLEQRTRQATDHILREVQAQARVMLNAVAGELRSFRDEFGKEIQERTGTLDRAAQQALEWKEKLDASLPRAEEVLRSLSVARRELSAQVQSASTDVEAQLQSSREALRQEIESETASLQRLLEERRQGEERFRKEIEKFQRESAAACDVLGKLADHSIERLNAEAEEATGRVRAGLENLATEVERRILSGGLVERATGEIETAAQAVVEPAIERVKSAGAEAESAADSLNRAGQEVVGRMGAARQEIETRLDALMGEQQGLLEASMAGFHRKAAEELGNLVERVVAQSSQQLDERLQVLCQDLLAATSKQINGAARSTLSTLHQGLKEVFEPETNEAEATSTDLPEKE
ncbi:MAG: hypothetical protein KGL59_06965 [Acidobacteriota bacterium]|nr:hypothetical protein [Acidobacteriota bacterium]